MQPFLTFIVPCYNAELYVQHCIDSVLAQSIQEWELLLIDDGSSDNTAKICQYAQKLDSRIVYIHQENKGVSSARNKGLQLATGEFITCIDADDWIEPNFIKTFKKDVLADINICGYREIYPNGKVRTEWIPETLYSKIPLDTYTVRNSYFRTPWAVIFRRNFLKNNKLYFLEDLSWGEDTMFLLFATIKANDISFISEVLYNYRYTGEGLTNSPCRHHNMVKFLDVYSSNIKTIRKRSANASSMMDELVLFLSIILLKEVVISNKTKQDKIDIVNNIHKYLNLLPFLYILKTKVGRIRYVAAICSRLLPSSLSLSVYKLLV